MKNYVFDIDGTVCTNTEGVNDYRDAEPLLDRIDIVNKLYEEGNRILFLTARGMGRNNNDIEKAYEQFYEFTAKQLDRWGVKYHRLFLGKPAGDIYVDDKGIKDTRFFSDQES